MANDDMLMAILRYLLISAITGYLIGNIQFAVILSRLMYNEDVRSHGSGNAGTTNMIRVFGLKPGLFTFIGDFLKGILGVIIGRLIAGEVGAYVCALFVVVGHDYPVFLKFRGGKGVASSFAILWMLNPLYAAIVTIIAALTLYLSGTVAIASLTGAAAYFLLTLIFSWPNKALILLVAILFALVLIRHVENIRRIIRGEEGKLFDRKKGRQA